MPESSAISADEAKKRHLQGALRDGIIVQGVLDLSQNTLGRAPAPLPKNLKVDVLNLQGQIGLTELPSGLQAFEINLAETGIRSLPADLQVSSRLDLSNCSDLETLPPA